MTERKVKLDRANKSILLRAMFTTDSAPAAAVPKKRDGSS